MKKLFSRLEMMQKRSFKLRISENRFRDLLYHSMDNKYHISISNATSKEYRGTVRQDSFKLQPNRVSSKRLRFMAILKGQIQRLDDDSIIIHLEPNGFTWDSLLILIMSISFISGSIPLYLLMKDLEILSFLPIGIIGLGVVIWIS